MELTITLTKNIYSIWWSCSRPTCERSIIASNNGFKYFPDKIVMINDDIINCSSYNPSVNRKHLLDYALGKGMGFRDDSILWVGNTVGNCGYDTMRTPFMFDLFAENAPVDIELDHLKQVKDDVYKDGMPIYEALKRAHATYCGFHCYPQDSILIMRYS